MIEIPPEVIAAGGGDQGKKSTSATGKEHVLSPELHQDEASSTGEGHHRVSDYGHQETPLCPNFVRQKEEKIEGRKEGRKEGKGRNDLNTDLVDNFYVSERSALAVLKLLYTFTRLQQIIEDNGSNDS